MAYLNNSEAANLRNQYEKAKATIRSAEKRIDEAKALRDNARVFADEQSSKLMDQIIKRLNSEIKNTEQDYKSTEVEIRRQIGEQNLKFAKKISEINSKVEETEKRQTLLEDEVKKLSTSINSRINDFLKCVNKESDRSKQYLLQFDEFLGICEKLNAKKLKPDEYADFQKRFKTAKLDYEEKEYAASIVISQKCIYELNELQGVLELLNYDFNKIEYIVTEQLENLRKIVDELYAEFDVNYWSNNMFDVLLKDLNALSKTVKEEYIPQMNIEELHNTSSKLFTLEEQFFATKELAFSEWMSFKEIIFSAQKIHDLVTESGIWKLKKQGFFNGDQRGDFFLEYLDGHETICDIAISPCGIQNEEELENGTGIQVRVNIDSLDSDVSLSIRRTLIDLLVENGFGNVLQDDNENNTSSNMFANNTITKSYEEKNKRILNVCIKNKIENKENIKWQKT